MSRWPRPGRSRRGWRAFGPGLLALCIALQAGVLAVQRVGAPAHRHAAAATPAQGSWSLALAQRVHDWPHAATDWLDQLVEPAAASLRQHASWHPSPITGHHHAPHDAVGHPHRHAAGEAGVIYLDDDPSHDPPAGKRSAGAAGLEAVLTQTELPAHRSAAETTAPPPAAERFRSRVEAPPERPPR